MAFFYETENQSACKQKTNNYNVVLASSAQFTH